jgi:hypothetical protein
MTLEPEWGRINYCGIRNLPNSVSSFEFQVSSFKNAQMLGSKLKLETLFDLAAWRRTRFFGL